MFVVQIFLLKYDTLNIPKDYLVYSVFSYHIIEVVDFTALILSTVLIAASGNIINDYFDVKADRVNKPNRLIIDKYIKRRWAMMFHWIFSSVGFIIALAIGYHLHNVWVPMIAFLSINLLWFYSAYYKRRPLIGNVIVALLIGVLPIYVMVYNWPLISVPIENNDVTRLIVTDYFIDVILIVSSLAFLQNLIRELTKDIQDVRGDLKLGAKTFPIKYGIKKTKWLITLIGLLTIILSAFFYIYIWNFDFNMQGATMGNGINLEEISSFDVGNFSIMLISSLITFLISLFLVLFFNKSKTYKIASVLLKFAMLFGLLTPLFL
jgi:4-hydroxybenzoate polyprenyltransferase